MDQAVLHEPSPVPGGGVEPPLRGPKPRVLASYTIPERGLSLGRHRMATSFRYAKRGRHLCARAHGGLVTRTAEIVRYWSLRTDRDSAMIGAWPRPKLRAESSSSPSRGSSRSM